jgi:hypothetical protein
MKWSRFRAFFPKSRRQVSSEDPPRRQGMAITISVLTSCILWFTFTMQEEYVRVLDMPTEVINLPVDQALAELPPRTVRVELQGPGWQLFGLFGLDGDLPAIPIDASQNQVNLTSIVQNANFTGNVSILRVFPAEITLSKETRVGKRIPVRLNARIDTPPEYDIVQEPTLIPDSVYIVGARSVVNAINFWPTVHYENLDVRDTLRVTVPLVDTLEGLLSRTPDSVVLETAAQVFTQGSREIEVILRGILSPEQYIRLDPPTIEVTYRVPVSQYDAALEAPDFYAEVAYESILQDTTGRIRPNINLPEDLDIRDVESSPATIRAFQVIEQ